MRILRTLFEVSLHFITFPIINNDIHLKSTLLFTLLTTCSFVSSAQYIKGQGSVKDEVEGQTLFTLNEGTFIYSDKSEALWYEVSKRVVFHIDQLTPDSTLPAGTKLFDDNLEEIGEVQSETPVEQITAMTGFRRGDYRVGILKGYCSTFDTKTNSRPEGAIENALEGRGSQAQLLSEVHEAYNWEEEVYDNYKVWVLRNTDENNYPENPPMRLMLVWRGATLVCILSPKAYITGNKSKEQSEIANGDVYSTWFQRPNARLSEEIETIALRYLNFDEPGTTTAW